VKLKAVVTLQDSLAAASMMALAKLHDLRTLSMFHNDYVNDSNLPTMAPLKSLTRLELRYCTSFTDAGLQVPGIYDRC
jgi:hypothetical protein